MNGMYRPRWSVTTLAAVLLGLLALASVANASPSCPGVMTPTIHGVGSSIQKVAQESAWIPAYTRECGEVSITYESTGSGEGLRAWHAEGSAGTAAESGKAFIATDVAPERAQMRHMEEAARGSIALVPVAQAAVSMIMHLPEAGCRVRQITNAALERIWNGATTRWETIEANCRGAITRIVRLGTSGTTFQFKHYLWEINRGAIGARTWLQYQEPTENPNWPAAIRRETAEGGGQLVREVNATAGSIGYANLADVVANRGAGTVALRVQNNGTEAVATFAEPEVGSNSNCLRTAYFNRLGATNGGAQIREPTLTTAWEEIYGSNPAIGLTAGKEEAYPICTLTWIGVMLDYERAGFAGETDVGVASYVSFIIEEQLRAMEGIEYAGPPVEFKEGERGVRRGTTTIVAGIRARCWIRWPLKIVIERNEVEEPDVVKNRGTEPIEMVGGVEEAGRFRLTSEVGCNVLLTGETCIVKMKYIETARRPVSGRVTGAVTCNGKVAPIVVRAEAQ